MTPPIEKVLPIVVKALLEISPWPWDRFPLREEGYTYFRIGRKLPLGGKELVADYIAERNLDFLAASPLWLASLVVALVKERAEHECDILDHIHAWCDLTITQTLSDFSISPSDYEEIKRRVEG